MGIQLFFLHLAWVATGLMDVACSITQVRISLYGSEKKITFALSACRARVRSTQKKERTSRRSLPASSVHVMKCRRFSRLRVLTSCTMIIWAGSSLALPTLELAFALELW